MMTFDIGIDLGATLVKAAAVPAGRSLASFESFLCPAADEPLLDAFLQRYPARRICATGGGASRLAARLGDRVPLSIVDEFEAWGAGESLLISEAGFSPGDPHLLVSLGTGTSILKVGPPGRVLRVGGTALGGGTVRGLGALLLGESEHDRIVALAARGDRRRIDLLVGDLYRPGEIALVPDLTAANFGKLGSRRPEDLAHAIMGLVGENVALLAGELARRCIDLPQLGGPFRRPNILFAGSTLRNNPVLAEVLRDVTALMGATAQFLPNGEMTGAAGALTHTRGEV